MQKAVGIEVMEISRVPVHDLFERPIQKPDVLEWKGTDCDGDLGLDFIGACRFFTLAGGAGKREPEDAEPDQQ
jgi:hypothetical protein